MDAEDRDFINIFNMVPLRTAWALKDEAQDRCQLVVGRSQSELQRGRERPSATDFARQFPTATHKSQSSNGTFCLLFSMIYRTGAEVAGEWSNETGAGRAFL